MDGSQQDIWNKIAETWSKFRKKAPEDSVEFLKEKKGKILDLGCGSGRNIIANSNIIYYGVDFSENMLKYAEQEAKNKKINAVFFKADIGVEKLPFEKDFFDSAVFISALHCIETAEKRENALKELYRVLKKDAEAMITVWDRASNKYFAKTNAKEGFLKWREGKYDRYYYFYDKEELEEILKRAGFRNIKIKHQIFALKESRHSKKNLIFYAKK